MRPPLVPLLLVGCSVTLAVASPRDPREISFATPAARSRFEALRADLGKRAAGFHHVGPRFLGNFVSETWCAPTTTLSACERGAMANDRPPGTIFYRLETLHYEKDWPRVFGLIVSAADLPAEKDGLGIELWLAEDGRTIVGDGLTVTWLGQEQAGYVPRASLGSAVSVTVHGQKIAVRAPGSWQDELGRMTASAESLRTTAEARYRALLAAVRQKLDAGEIQGHDVGPYQGGGIPPVRTPRPLTAAEKSSAWAQAERDVNAQVAFVRAHHLAMHARLRAALPVELLLRR